MRALKYTLPLIFVLFAGLCIAQPGKTVKEIKARGYLKCGVSTGLPGFSYINSSGNWAGFDVDFCKATKRHLVFSSIYSSNKSKALAQCAQDG